MRQFRFLREMFSEYMFYGLSEAEVLFEAWMTIVRAAEY